MSTQIHPLTRLRSSLANAAWAVEDRVVIGGGDLLRGAAAAVKWPFERIAWAVEEWMVWPLDERTAGWSPALRGGGAALLVALALGAGAAGVLWASSGDGDPVDAGVTTAPALSLSPQQATEGQAAAPLLKGAAPVFEPEADGGVPSRAAGALAGVGAAKAGSEAPKAAAGVPAIIAPGGPAAMKVARRFAGAFVLYETGRGGDEARTAIRETAMPPLARSLLRRPPRQPANVTVPKARVLNVVPGPRLGAILTVSASLLRVGVTSELRIDLQRTRDGPRVVSVLG